MEHLVCNCSVVVVEVCTRQANDCQSWPLSEKLMVKRSWSFSGGHTSTELVTQPFMENPNIVTSRVVKTDSQWSSEKGWQPMSFQDPRWCHILSSVRSSTVNKISTRCSGTLNCSSFIIHLRQTPGLSRCRKCTVESGSSLSTGCPGSL